MLIKSGLTIFRGAHKVIGYQLDTLADLGIQESKIIRFHSSSFFHADRILYPRLSGYNQQYQDAWKINFLEKIYPECWSESKSRRRRLFVSRQKDSFRNLINEYGLFQMLAADGFEKIDLQGVSLKETIAIFSQAEVVVGPFGSGLMNIAFCRKGTKVVEIATPSFYNCYHWYLSGAKGLQHAVYFGDGGRADSKSVTSILASAVSMS